MNNVLSEWRMEKARKIFTEGEQLLEHGSYLGAVNRFYFAIFNAARALLATRDMDSAKHSGVISLFNREFVKVGIISKETSKALTALFDLRSRADYDDFVEFTQNETEKIRDRVQLAVNEISSFLDRDRQ
ncbi:MAG: HEPN domain-containing protein [Desulfitobacteriaceae bacterium]